MTNYEDAMKNVRDAANTVIANFAAEAEKFAKTHPERKADAEAQMQRIKYQVEGKIVPAYAAAYDDRFADDFSANRIADDNLRRQNNPLLDQVLGFFQRELHTIIKAQKEAEEAKAEETTVETKAETTEATADSTSTAAEKLPVNINAVNAMLLTGCLFGEAQKAWNRGEEFCWTRHDIEIIVRGIDDAIADLGPDNYMAEMLKGWRQMYADALNRNTSDPAPEDKKEMEEKTMKTTIYACYGLPTQEKETVYGVTPTDICDEITVEIPEELEPYETVTGSIAVMLPSRMGEKKLAYMLEEVLCSTEDGEPAIRTSETGSRTALKVIG